LHARRALRYRDRNPDPQCGSCGASGECRFEAAPYLSIG
jgi:hypothetical protein